VRRYLERQILGGGLAPGQRIIELDVSRRLRLSRSPVREALRWLVSDGLVEVHPRRGGRVSPISPRQVRDTFEVFEALESLATRLAAAHVGEREVRTFRRLLAGMGEAVAAGDVDAYFRLNARFHETIYRAAGNATLHRFLVNLGKQITRFRFAALATPGRMARSLREHRALVAALGAGDARRATRLARASVIHARRALEASLASADGLDRSREEGARGAAR